jgi:hypothetical protein
MSMRNGREDGASAVEFALIFPLLAMMLFGMITGGLALNQQQQINHAAREGARFGATLPGFPDEPEEDTYRLVARRAVAAAVGPLNVNDAFICVMYRDEDNPALDPVWYAGSDSSLTPLGSTPAGLSCPDLLGSDDARIQVMVFLPARIEAVFVRRDITLSAEAVSIYEVGL